MSKPRPMPEPADRPPQPAWCAAATSTDRQKKEAGRSPVRPPLQPHETKRLEPGAGGDGEGPSERVAVGVVVVEVRHRERRVGIQDVLHAQGQRVTLAEIVLD